MTTTNGLLPWRKYLCRACGLIYDEELGDPDSGLAPGTRFEDVPDDWVCPLCGVMKADFEPYAGTSPSHAEETARPEPSPMRRGGKGVVIIGAGIAGWTAAEALRALDRNVSITLVTACRGDRYHKPELSVAMGRGLSVRELIRESGTDAARRLDVTLMSDTFAVGLSPRLHQLRTTRGALRYTKLVLAQGSRPALPDTLPARLCWRINDLDGWSGLHAKLHGKIARVAVVGAGMIGCELAEDLARAGHRVTLIDINAYPLAGLVPPVVAELLIARLRDAGIGYLGSTRIKQIDRIAGDAMHIAIDTGETLAVDEIVAATGLVTESRLALAAGLSFEQGIAVNPHTMQTSDANIYALGDCVSVAGAPCRFIEPISRQADTLAHHALAHPHAVYRHTVPVIRLKTRSLPIVIHGLPVAGGVWDAPEPSGDGLFVKQWHDNRIVARLEAGHVAPRIPE